LRKHSEMRAKITRADPPRQRAVGEGVEGGPAERAFRLANAIKHYWAERGYGDVVQVAVADERIIGVSGARLRIFEIKSNSIGGLPPEEGGVPFSRRRLWSTGSPGRSRGNRRSQRYQRITTADPL
jgi:hypothetical protein